MKLSNDDITFLMTSLACWHQHCQLVTSLDFSWNLVYYSRNRNFWTTYRIKMVNPHLKALREIFRKKTPIWHEFCWCQHFFSRFGTEIHENTSRDARGQIFIKHLENAYFLDILLVTIFEVICISWRKVMNISVFSGFIWKNYEISN